MELTNATTSLIGHLDPNRGETAPETALKLLVAQLLDLHGAADVDVEPVVETSGRVL